MADPREFVLIGSFKDEITPKLERINQQVKQLTDNFAGVGGRRKSGFNAASRSIGKLVAANKNLAKSFKEVQSSISTTTGALKKYTTQLNQAAAANKRFKASGGNLGSKQAVKELKAADQAAMRYLKTLNKINSATPKTMRGPRGGGYGGGGGGGYGGGGGGGRRGGGFFDSTFAEFGFSYVLGSKLSNTIQTAVTSGFVLGAEALKKPFEYFAGAFGERVRDELSDLKAAGGLYSISKRSDSPFLKSIDDAIQFQQDTNVAFAKMAASLPGVTNDYVQVGKRLSDTAARIVQTDFGKAKAMAEKIRATEEGRQFYGGAIQGTQAEQTKEVIKTLLGELTKKTTLAGLGGSRSAGGVAGAYGLPGITERILSQQTVSIGQFQRYASVFSDPTISDALRRNIDEINKTTVNSAERFAAVQKMLDEIVTPELIDKLRTSVDGVYQGLKSAIFDPDQGLFGLSRQFKAFGKKINSYGEYVDKAGKAVDSAAMAADEDLSLFEVVRDIFSTLGQTLTPIVENLYLVFDPLKAVTSQLKDVRHYTAQFAKTFNQYREGLKQLAKSSGKGFLLDNLDLRASFAAIANLFKQFNVIDSATFKNLSSKIMSKDLDIGSMMSGLLNTFLDSKIAKQIGETIGKVIGTVFVEVAKVTGFISGRLSKAGGLMEGLKQGFGKEGLDAAKQVVRDIFKALFTAVLQAIKTFPLELAFLGTLTMVLPAIAQFTGLLIADKLFKAIGLLGRSTSFEQGIASAAGGGMSGRRGKRGRYGRGGSIDRLNRMRRYKMGQVGQFGMEAAAFGYNMSGRPGRKMGKGFKVPKGLRRMGRAIPGGALATGAIDMGLALASGENFGKAAAGALGTVIGGAVGSIFGPAGTVIGSIAGGYLGDVAYNYLDPAAKIQKEAAELQLQAANKAAGVDRITGAVGAAKAEYQFGDIARVKSMLDYAGYGKDAAAQGLLKEYAERNVALEKLKSDLVAKETALAQIEAQKLPEEKAAAILKPLETAIQKSKAAYEKEQKELAAKFAQTPQKITDALTGVISKMPTSQIDEAIAQRIRREQFSDFMNKVNNRPKPPSALDQISSLFFKPGYKGNIGDAIRTEMKHKPPGSDLVIANSSETIIPAHKGLYSRSPNFTSGSTVNGGIHVTVQAGNVSDPDQLASIVAMKISEAVADARASSIFV